MAISTHMMWQTPTVLDAGSRDISTYDFLPGAVYASPAYQVRPSFGPYGIPYIMQGFYMQTCVIDFAEGGAPEPYRANMILQPTQGTRNAGQFGIGAAPTKGVYTGVE